MRILPLNENDSKEQGREDKVEAEAKVEQKG
jgi:hypothetical protein